MKIPCFKLIAKAEDDEAKSLRPFKWTDSIIGKRHQLGGKPTGIEDSDFPKCPCCGGRMTFYGQLDSINDDYIIADCGLIAVFICFNCYEVKAEIISD